jgi:hypothetical protein
MTTNICRFPIPSNYCFSLKKLNCHNWHFKTGRAIHTADGALFIPSSISALFNSHIFEDSHKAEGNKSGKEQFMNGQFGVKWPFSQPAV